MLRFRTYTILYENRIDYLKRTMGDIDSSHDTLAKHRDTDKIVDHFATHADPSPNKQYTQWIMNKYKSKTKKDQHIPGQFRQEDAGRIRTALQGFEEHRSKLEHKDINQYGSLSQLEDAISPHLDKPKELSKSQIEKQTKAEGTDHIYEDDNLRVLHLKTHEAAKLYAAGTKWCTTQKNMFDTYNKNGPILYLEDKKTKEKHQLHLPSDQFMNAKDEPVNLKDFVDKHPGIRDSSKLKDIIGGDLRLGQHLLHPHELDSHIENIKKNGSLEDKQHLIRNIDKTHEYFSNSSDPELRKTVVQATSGDSPLAQKLSKDPDENVRAEVVNQYKHQKTIQSMIDDKSTKILKFIIDSHYHTIGHNFINHPNEELRSHAIMAQLIHSSEPISDEIAQKHIPDNKLAKYYKRLSPAMKDKALDKLEIHDKIPYEDQIVTDALKKNHNSAIDTLSKHSYMGSMLASAVTAKKHIPLLTRLAKSENTQTSLSALKQLSRIDPKNAESHYDAIMSNDINLNEYHPAPLAVAANSSNQEHIKKLMKITDTDRYNNLLLKNPHVTDEDKKKIASNTGDFMVNAGKTAKHYWGNQKSELVKHMEKPEHIDAAWKNRHNSGTFLIKNQKFVKAILDNPNTSAKTRAEAQATMDKYEEKNKTFKPSGRRDLE